MKKFKRILKFIYWHWTKLEAFWRVFLLAVLTMSSVGYFGIYAVVAGIGRFDDYEGC